MLFAGVTVPLPVTPAFPFAIHGSFHLRQPDRYRGIPVGLQLHPEYAEPLAGLLPDYPVQCGRGLARSRPARAGSSVASSLNSVLGEYAAGLFIRGEFATLGRVLACVHRLAEA